MNKYTKQKKDDIKNIQNTRNNLLLSRELLCPYCQKITNLYQLKNQHFKSARCINMKALYFKNKKEEDPTEYDILKKMTAHILSVSKNINVDNVKLR